MTRVRVPAPHEVSGVIRMLTRAYAAARADFPDDDAVLGRYSEHDPGGGDEAWVVIWDGAFPISALRLFYRELEVEGRAVPFAGIGNVGTDPDHGGRGLGRAVMEAAHARLEAEGVSVALLVTDIPRFYERLGYRVVEQRELVAHVAEVDGTRPSVNGARRLRPDEPTPGWARALHADLAATTGGRVRRSAAYWERWIDTFRAAPPVERWTLPEAAYLVGRSEEGGSAYRVLEAAGTPAAVAGLVGAAAGRATTIKAPDDAAGRDPLTRLASAVDARTRRGIMARPIVAGGLDAGAFSSFLELDTF